MRGNLATFEEEIKQNLPGMGPFQYSKDLSLGAVGTGLRRPASPRISFPCLSRSPLSDPQDSEWSLGSRRSGSSQPPAHTVVLGLYAETHPLLQARHSPVLSPCLGRPFEMPAQHFRMSPSSFCLFKTRQPEGSSSQPTLVATSDSFGERGERGSSVRIQRLHPMLHLEESYVLTLLFARRGLLLIGTGAKSFFLPRHQHNRFRFPSPVPGAQWSQGAALSLMLG